MYASFKARNNQQWSTPRHVETPCDLTERMGKWPANPLAEQLKQDSGGASRNFIMLLVLWITKSNKYEGTRREGENKQGVSQTSKGVVENVYKRTCYKGYHTLRWTLMELKKRGVYHTHNAQINIVVLLVEISWLRRPSWFTHWHM